MAPLISDDLFEGVSGALIITSLGSNIPSEVELSCTLGAFFVRGIFNRSILSLLLGPIFSSYCPSAPIDMYAISVKFKSLLSLTSGIFTLISFGFYFL